MIRSLSDQLVTPTNTETSTVTSPAPCDVTAPLTGLSRHGHDTGGGSVRRPVLGARPPRSARTNPQSGSRAAARAPVSETGRRDSGGGGDAAGACCESMAGALARARARPRPVHCAWLRERLCVLGRAALRERPSVRQRPSGSATLTATVQTRHHHTAPRSAPAPHCQSNTWETGPQPPAGGARRAAEDAAGRRVRWIRAWRRRPTVLPSAGFRLFPRMTIFEKCTLLLRPYSN